MASNTLNLAAGSGLSADYYNVTAANVLGSMIAVVWMWTVLVSLVVSVLVIVGWWKIFTKAGEKGWKALIPIYNFYVLLRIVGQPWWFLLLLLVPGVNFIIVVLTYHALAKSFGKGAGFTLGLIFLQPIFFLILGFGGAKYLGASGD